MCKRISPKVKIELKRKLNPFVPKKNQDERKNYYSNSQRPAIRTQAVSERMEGWWLY
jgi:hypothetical protein